MDIINDLLEKEQLNSFDQEFLFKTAQAMIDADDLDADIFLDLPRHASLTLEAQRAVLAWAKEAYLSGAALALESLAENPSLHPEIQEEVFTAASAEEPPTEGEEGVGYARANLASNPAATPEIQRRLLALGYTYHLASNPEAMPEVIIAMLREPNEHVRHALAANPRTPAENLEQFFEDPDLREHLAANPSTSAELRAKLFATRDEEVLSTMSFNDRFGLEEVRTLARSARVEDRRMAAGSSALPGGLQLELTRDKDAGVLSRLASNTALTEEAADVLLGSLSMARRLAENPSLSNAQRLQLLDGASNAVLGALASHSNLAPMLLSTILRSGNKSCFRAVPLDRPGLVLEEWMPASFATRHRMTLHQWIRDHGGDPAVLDVLAPTWEGDLGSLLAATRTLAGETAAH